MGSVNDQAAAANRKPLKGLKKLFSDWLTEWMEQEQSKDSKKSNSYKKALESLVLCPLEITKTKDCMLLNNFGKKICDQLDRQLRQYRIEHPEQQFNVNSRSQLQKNANKFEYIPSKGTSEFAILLALYSNSLQSDFQGFMTKNELIAKGQHLSTISLTKPTATAWDFMKTLISKDLVIKKSNPAKYCLTAKGNDLAKHLQAVENYVSDNDGEDDDSGIDGSLLQNVGVAGESSNQNYLHSSNDGDTQDDRQLRKSIKMKEQTEKEFADICNLIDTNFANSTFKLGPIDYYLLLLVDTREAGQLGLLVTELERRKIKFEVRKLNVGNYVWILREKFGFKELILPYIVERIISPDLDYSITSKAFYEQKFRLRHCGLQHVFYIFEESRGHCELPKSTLFQAVVNLKFHCNFNIKFTKSYSESLVYLANFTNALIKKFQTKTFFKSTREVAEKYVESKECIPLIEFSEYQKITQKTKDVNVKDFFARILLMICNMTIEKSLKIVEKYPSPKILSNAYKRLNPKDAEVLLSGIKYSDNKTIGKALSRSIYLFITKDYYR